MICVNTMLELCLYLFHRLIVQYRYYFIFVLQIDCAVHLLLYFSSIDWLCSTPITLFLFYRLIVQYSFYFIFVLQIDCAIHLLLYFCSIDWLCITPFTVFLFYRLIVQYSYYWESCRTNRKSTTNMQTSFREFPRHCPYLIELRTVCTIWRQNWNVWTSCYRQRTA